MRSEARGAPGSTCRTLLDQECSESIINNFNLFLIIAISIQWTDSEVGIRTHGIALYITQVGDSLRNGRPQTRVGTVMNGILANITREPLEYCHRPQAAHARSTGSRVQQGTGRGLRYTGDAAAAVLRGTMAAS